LNSTGESDLRNYYDAISSEQELTLRPALRILDDLIVRNAVGEAAADKVWYTWSPLWQVTDKEKADIGKTIAETMKALVDTQLYPPEALSKASVTVLSERGVLPGFEQTMSEFEFEELDAIEEPTGALLTEDRLTITDATPRSLYVQRKVLNKQSFIDWAEEQGLPAINTDLHVTVVHSRDAINWMKLGQDWNADRDGVLRIPPGGPRTIERLEDVIVLEFTSSDLEWRNTQAREAGASFDYDEYRPHITLAPAEGVIANYENIEPYRGPIVLGPEIFEEIN
jgi:hypothetical protein